MHLSNPTYPFAIAHRAGNSAATLEAARQLQADVIEVDLNLYRGHIEMRHEESLGWLPLTHENWRLARRPHPPFRLPQLLQTPDPLLLDLKGVSPGLSRRLVAALSRDYRRPYWVCTRRWRLLEPFVAEPQATVLFSIGNRRELAAALARFPAHGGTHFSVSHELLTAEVMGQLRERAGMVVAWTVNEPARAAELIGLGVHGITTDSAAVVQAVHAIGDR